MAATSVSSTRCVIWFGNPGAREKVMLAADGWQVRTVLPQQPADIGMRGGDTVVGLIDFRTVLDTQRTLLSAQDSVASAQASLATGHVRLYKALGGGWTPDTAAPSAAR